MDGSRWTLRLALASACLVAIVGIWVGLSAPQRPTAPAPSSDPAGSIALCDDLPQLSAPADYYRAQPVYVWDEMEPALEQIQAWASGKPGFEDIWIDRTHNGWITLAFSVDAAARQAELLAAFPDVGVVAVQVDWTTAQLTKLQQRILQELRQTQVLFGSGIYSNMGVVSIEFGVLEPELVALAEELFAGERVCLKGMAAADAPPEGPQPLAGDGWRLLADQDEVGESYRTGIAYDEDSYAELWRRVGLVGDRPAVDFETEVVIWFGAVHSSSCPRLRLDDVEVNPDRSLVHGDIVQLDVWPACTADAVPHAYVVALERSRLPHGPFSIQLGAQAPPAGVPEERTVVDVDLSAPGSVAGAGEIHRASGPNVPEPHGPGEVIMPGLPALYRQSTHCGLEWLGPLNHVNWRTEAASGEVDWIPPQWKDKVADGAIDLRVVIETDPEPTLTATANGHSVVYRATADDPPGCD